MRHSHYHKDVSHLDTIDVYRVCQLFDVTDPCLAHAIKKLLCAGQRGAKTEAQDVQEAIDALTRYQGMQSEDLTATQTNAWPDMALSKVVYAFLEETE